MFSGFRFALVLGALASVGCSDEPITTPAAGGVAGQGSAGAGGAVAGMAGLGGTSGAAGTDSAPPKPCTSYVDDPAWSLVVTIKNEMTQTLYLGQETSTCEEQRLFEVQDGARNVLPALKACRASCQAATTMGPVACPAACAMPATVTLEPGQTVQIPWDGRFGVDEVLPQQCVMPGGTAGNCVRAARIEPNVYTFVARAGTRRQCLDPSGACSCTPNATGGCTATGSVIAGTIITTELLLKLEPGETSPSGEPPFIGLSFKDQ